MSPELRRLILRSERLLKQNKQLADVFFAKVAEIKQFLDGKKDREKRELKTLKVTTSPKARRPGRPSRRTGGKPKRKKR